MEIIQGYVGINGVSGSGLSDYHETKIFWVRACIVGGICRDSVRKIHTKAKLSGDLREKRLCHASGQPFWL